MSSFSFLGRNLNFHLRKRTTTAKPPMHLLEPFSWEQHLCLGWRVPAVPWPPQGQRLPCWPRRLHPECPPMTRTSWQASHALCWQRGKAEQPTSLHLEPEPEAPPGGWDPILQPSYNYSLFPTCAHMCTLTCVCTWGCLHA